MSKAYLGIAALAIVLFCAGCSQTNEASLEEIDKGSANNKVSVHDPQIVLGEDGTYYMTGSHMTGAKSSNLVDWTMFADGVNVRNELFDNLFDDDLAAFTYVGKNEEGKYSVWAPDIIYNKKMEKYVMYFCTTSSYIKSNLCFATSDSPEGPFTYQDTILYSGFISSTIDSTNFYEIMPSDTKKTDYISTGSFNNLQWPNCIDPSLFYDEDGKMWMVYGSWSGGIFLLEIDENTGYPIHPAADLENNVDTYFGKKLAGGGHNSIEGPYITYHKDSGYYYLLVSYGALTREGGYQIRQFRSKTVDGEYLDAKGQSLSMVLDHSEYGVKMMGNYTLPSLDETYMAPGGQSAFWSEDETLYMVYHQRFNNGTEYHEPRTHQLFVTSDGWLTAAPFAATETPVKLDTNQEEAAGTWYLLNHGSDISSKIRTTKEVTLKKGEISGELSGTYEQKDRTSITIKIDQVSYQCVVFEMTDEANNPVRCISGVGENNQTIWAVQYLKTATK